MSKVTVFVGLDYATSFVQVCVLDRDGRQQGNRRCENDVSAIASYVRQFGDRAVAAVETCTGAANLAERLNEIPGWHVDLAHAGYVKRLKQSPDKTDYSDARLLAELQCVGYLPKVWLASEFTRELRKVVHYRQTVANQRRDCKLRIRAILRDHRVTLPEATPWTKAWCVWLQHVQLPVASRWIVDRHLVDLQLVEERLKEAAKQLEQMVTDDMLTDELRKQPGIGLLTACMLRAEIGRFDRFNSGKQLARFCGLTPRNASSGDFKMRLADNGKKPPVIAAAVANRWIRGLYHRMKELRPAA